YLYVGPNICTLEFSWQSIYSHGVDGPYYITLELQDASWVTLDSDDHWTAGYLVSEFEYAVFSPPHSDSGRDTNSNGMYDELIVNASVDVSSENWYRIEATLRDGMGLWIGSASVRVYLASGSSVVVLVFDGVAIRSHGVDGPYNVDLLIRDDSSTLLNSDTHSTAAYLYTDFEYVPPGAVFLPPHSNYGNDTNSNGLYEMLCVAVSVNVVTEGWYHVYSILYDKFFHGIQNYWSDHYLLTGHQTITLAFSGYMISRNGVDGPYHVGMDIYDSTWAWCDSDTYLTASYSVGSFEYASLSPPHADYGADKDGNGYYDQLMIDAVIEVSSAGWYWIDCTLRDNLSAVISHLLRHEYLVAGANTVHLPHPWQSIFSHGVDGPYVAEMNLYDDSSNLLDSDTHVTSAYLVKEFEYAVLPPMHSDHGDDSDANGLFNALVIDLAIDVSSEGWYWVSGNLMDGLSNYIDGTGAVHVHLSSGLNIVPMSFSWERIFYHGADGPYHFEASLWDDGWNFLDSDTYVTGAYLISEFEYGVFSPPHADHGEDTNSNGRYDYLVVEASVEVSCAGWYEVDGFLYDSLNNLIDQATVNVYLTMGTHAVPLSFSGIAIFNNGMDGPYGVYLYLSDGVGPLGGGSHTTSAYLQTEFEQPSHFEPPHSDDGYDANGNGLYDALVLYATVNASEEDWYYVFAELYDGASNLICSDGWDHVYLSAGLNSVQFSFDWKMIYAHGVDGPYTVHMYLENDSWVPLDSDSHVTRAYLLSEFEHVFYSPPYSDYGVDSNGNGLYDELIVEVSVDVSSSGWFWLYAELTDGFGTTIDYDGAYEVFLIAGSNNFAFSFDGIDIYNSGIDGPYNVEMEIYDSWPYGTLLNSDAYATSPYLYVEFEQLSHFSPPHADIGVDTNSNGQYDNLIVTAYVSATTDGWYTVYGDLYDANSTWIDSASANVYLFAGLNFIDLSFSGIAIFINGVDGPYVVDLDLYDSHGWCDSDVHMTAAYLYTEFEHFGASFVPPHSDYGVDNDGNGLYDELAVEVNVDVLADGYYMIDYALTDNSSNWIDGGSIYISLSAGLNVIDISFSWENIFCHGADGPYFVNIQIYVWDSGWRFLDADTHKTNPYLLSDFEYAVLSPPHSDYGVDSNSNGFYEQLNVDIVVEVSYEGTYRIVANLYDGTSNWMDYAETLTYLVGGTNVVTMSFAGMKIFAHGVDGPYRVDIQLYDDLPWMPHLFDTDVHLTSGYLAKEFEGAAFSPPHSDYGDDTDSNGLYNYLVVEATVEVSSDGRFWVQGTLY
ncbi:MAG: hypothetical protein QXY98_05010, partial [Thermoplasmata archaeon]